MIEYTTLRNYTARVNDYQDDNNDSITDNLVYKQRMCRGWFQTSGDATTSISNTVTFPITYDNATEVTVVGMYIGSKTNNAAANINQLTVGALFAFMNSEDITANTVKFWILTTGLLTAPADYYGGAWIAHGTYENL